jgi:type III secretion protein T
MSETTLAFFQSGHHVDRYLALLALCSERLMVLMLIFPPTSDSVIQGTVRTALAMVWGGFFAYGQQGLIQDASAMTLAAIAVKEGLIGVVLGFAASSIFWAAESVGTYVDDLSGFNQLQLTNPTNGQQTSLTSTLLSQFSIAAFWSLGGMTFLLGAIYESYSWWPLSDLTPSGGRILESFVLQKTDSLMETVAKLAAPLMLLLLLVDIGFGFTGKVSQKLDFSSMARPVKGALTVLLLALMAGIFVDQVRGQLTLSGIADEARALAGVK